MREWRKRRLADPMARMRRKLMLLSDRDFAHIEKTVDSILLAQEKIKDASNPWA